MEQLTVKALYNLEETIAKDIFEGVTYPWEVLPKISGFIVELGNTISEEEYEKVVERVKFLRERRRHRRQRQKNNQKNYSKPLDKLI